MLRLLVITMCGTFGVKASFDSLSAASRAQIEFAKENNYDNTGPGAKSPEYAYKTYKTLEDALVSYLDDPDTKLPEKEKNQALRLITNHVKAEEYMNYQSKPNNELIINRYHPSIYSNVYQDHNINDGSRRPPNKLIGKNYYMEKYLVPLKLTKFKPIKNSPLNLAHYTKDPDAEETQSDFNPNPQYTYSYGVHDKDTGDSKSAHETRDGDVVKGYYTFADADGKQRTVLYTADEKNGFRATVQRTSTTSH